jgi:HEAT repeat protein
MGSQKSAESQAALSKLATSLTSGIPQQQLQALKKISGQEGVTGLAPLVVALADDDDDDVRMWAADAMETSVEPQPADVPELISLLEKSIGGSVAHGEVGYWAATMLGRLGSDGAAAPAALEHCLRNSPQLAARERAVWALSQIGPQAIVALPALQQAMTETKHPRLQRLATEASRRISRTAAREAA